jgi:hypothetical protein
MYLCVLCDYRNKRINCAHISPLPTSFYAKSVSPSLIRSFLFPVAPRPNSGLGYHIVEFSRPRTIAHTHTPSVTLPWTKDQPVAGAATHTKHHSHRRISMQSAGFEPAIPAIKRPQTYSLDRRTTEIVDLLGLLLAVFGGVQIFNYI